jgi:hypothetical protein
MNVLSGCNSTNRTKLIKINLPELPSINLNIEAEKDFKNVCNPKINCKNLDDFLAQIYSFRIKYDIYRLELSK